MFFLANLLKQDGDVLLEYNGILQQTFKQKKRTYT